MSNYVIRVKDMSKIYKLYRKPIDRLKESLQPFKKKYHKEFYAINDMSFEIKKGEIVGIIGKNGSGKSTLLKIITGVLTPSNGEIEINGTVSALLELGAGFNPEYTGIENIYLNGMIIGFTKEQIKQKLDAIIEFADIGDFIYQPIKTYSSGMFARLAFSVAVNVEPDILIVDEALAVGDLKFQQKSLRKMKDLINIAKAILFVSHDTTSVRNFCNRVIWLMDGKIFKDGEPKEITRMYDDFMSHGILPDSEVESSQDLNEIATLKNIENDFFDNIEWQSTQEGNVIGGSKAIIERVACYTKKPFKKVTQIEKETELVFLADISVWQKLDKPLVGLGIFNEKGIPIIHFSSYTLAREIKPFEAKKRVYIKIDFEIPNLKNGTYFIAIGLDDGQYGMHSVVHRVNEAYTLIVNRKDRFSKQHGMIILEKATVNIIDR